MDGLWDFLGSVNGVIWHPIVLYVVLGVGVLFTLWSGFSQFKALPSINITGNLAINSNARNPYLAFD